MKYLSHYIGKLQTEAMDKAGAFFAFSKSQMKEKTKPGIEYLHLFHGLYSPKENAKELFFTLDKIYQKGIKEDIKENGIKAIIHRELANYECQITMDISDCQDALAAYPITRNDIQKEWSEFLKKCTDNDLF